MVKADDSELFANSLIPDDLPIVLAHMKTITPMNDDTRVTFLYKYAFYVRDCE